MKLQISGMHCQACVKRVEKALNAVPSAQVQRVDVGSAELSVDALQEAAVLEAVRKAGFDAQASA